MHEVSSIWLAEWRPLAVIVVVFAACFWLPIGDPGFDQAILGALHLVKWYAQEHVLTCLVPALFIAGAIAMFISRQGVLRYLGPQANKALAYGVASISGCILAVCSCTVLPLFAGIYRMGAGLGPATAFLYAGPAVNILAIILTARVLGPGLGVARAVGAIGFSIVIGVLMHVLFRREESSRPRVETAAPPGEASRPVWHNAVFFGSMVGILIFANWAKPHEASGLWHAVHSIRWPLAGVLSLGLATVLAACYGLRWWRVLAVAGPVIVLAVAVPDQPTLAFGVGLVGLALATSTAGGDASEWFGATWGFAKQILPLLLLGVFAAGVLLGRPEHEGLIPTAWVSSSVGGNSLGANLFASVAGALMYFATLTEVPILEGLLASGMGRGPALALLLAGPALSLPSILVIRSVLGTRKTIVYVALVVVMATVSGLIYGNLVG